MAKKNTEITKANQKEIAQNLYLSGNMTQRAIAELVDINENTLGRWIVDGEWDLLRGALESSKGKILANLLKRMSTLTSTENFSADDAIKLSKVISDFSPSKMSISGQIETMHQFTAFIFERNHELAKQLAPLSKEFVNTRVKNAITSK